MLLHVLSLAAALVPASAYTARDMLSAPRPHAPVLNPDGNSALHVVDQWDAKTDLMSRTVSLLQLPSGKSEVLLHASAKEVGEVFWLRDEWAYMNGSTVMAGHEREEVYRFPEGVGASDVQYEGGKLFFVGKVWEGHGMEETDEMDKRYEGRGNTGVVYDELFVRHWDTWRTPGKGWTVGYVELAKGKVHDLFDKPQFGHCRFQDAPSYSINGNLIAVNYKPTDLDPARHTFTRLDIFNTDGEWLFPAQTPEHHGARSSPVISRKGDKIAFLAMKEDGYESDLNSVHIVKDPKRVTKGDIMDGMKEFREDYLVLGREMSPSQLTWSLDGESLYFIADVAGRAAVYRFWFGKKPLERIDVEGSASSIIDTPHGLLVTASSFQHPSRIYLDGKALTDTPSLDISPQDFWFEGATRQVHGWVINPGIKSAPLAFLIHGGPQSAWLDAWSTRWNPGLMALQGYFIVAINPTGSTGYGQDFTDAIQYNWGGSPYKDLVAGYHAVLDRYAEWIDANRTAALGGSYGGYMINWIQGHNPGFKALVCHDGTFDTTTSRYTTEEVYFLDREFGDPVKNRAVYEKWNPANHVGNWKTPELVIHSANDFRLVNSNGVAAFTALQMKDVTSRYLYFPDENHWVLKPSNSMRWHYEVFRWLDEWVGHGEMPKVEEVVRLGQMDVSQVVL